jgi:dephospho-CoA kinase
MSAHTFPPNLLRLGLTGGIGSGKSTVADFLKQRGAALIDADAISRSVTTAKGAAIEAIGATFGASFITQDDALDREAMRNLVFSDPSAKQKLEAIVHPLISNEIQRQTQQAIANEQRVIVYDVPLLVESGKRWRAQLDRVLLIDCQVQTQVARVMNRSGLSEATVRQIIQAQAPRTTKLCAADWVIYNDGISFEDLRSKVLYLPI